MPVSKFKIIAGLGNPGDKYVQTRHNIGFCAVEALASKNGLQFDKKRFDAQYVKARVCNQNVFFIKPMTYMNLSGHSIQKFAAYYQVNVSEIIIVHDDMDLEFGQIKVVKSRGHGGHNGVRSVINALGDKDFIRVRLGVGHPGVENKVTGHVLGKFTPDEIDSVNDLIEKASDACFHILEHGPSSAMNLFNTKS